MPLQSYHSSHGGFDFLGLRKGPSGAVEIVYDDGVARRMIWRVRTKAADHTIGEVLRYAVDQTKVLPALLSELKRRSIAIEAIAA
ncbi:MAG: hypothetical protein B7Z02_14615 [Rhodobacterales bacterium 32-67-9]|nr:MAG: hypothetical protein B7Z02_14615 [Rhodobacterales bacterium 32-67-9]